MRIRDVLSVKGREVAVVRPDDPVSVAVAEMARRGIGSVVASWDGRLPDGLVSEREVLLALRQGGAAVVHQPISSVMLSAFVTCTPEEPVEAVLGAMTATRLRHVPVLSVGGAVPAGELAGIVSIGDLVKSRLAELESDNLWLRDYLGAT